MRACAVEMHMDMSQQAFEQKLTRKMPDANRGEGTFCEPAQSKCTWTCHNRHFEQKLTRKMPDANRGASTSCEPAQSKCTWTCHNRHFEQKLTRKMPDANRGASTSCEPAKSKCTWTFHKRIQEAFVRKFSMKMHENAEPQSRGQHFAPACTVEKHMDMSQEAFCGKFTGKMSDTPDTTSIEHRPVTLTVRTLQCGHTVWGKTCTY